MNTDEEKRHHKIYNLVKASNLPDSIYTLTFEDFIADTDERKRALQAAKEYCWYPKTDKEIEEEHEHGWSITFHGTTGTGKTMLAYLIAKVNIFELQLSTIFWNVADLLNALRQGFKNDNYYKLLDTVKYCDVLILDDLGMEKTTDWAGEQIDAIIDYRYRHGYDTVVTTNLSLKQLQPRIASRLAEGTTVSMNGPDYRLLIGLGKAAKRKPIKTEVNTHKYDPLWDPEPTIPEYKYLECGV